MGLRQHLVDAHTAHGEFHSACMKAHDAYHKVLDDGPEKEFHKSMRDAHMAACEKSIASARHASTLDDSIPTGATGVPHKVTLPGEDRFSKIEVDGVQAIHGGVPEGLRLVSRFGSPSPDELEKAAGQIPDSVKHIFERGAGQ